MIPRTFPSISEDGKTKCVVYVLPSVTGLQAWKDYIPVKGITTENTAVENTYANDGYIVMKTVDGTQKAWIDYLPVFEDASYTKAWSTDVGGYIPASGLFSIRGTLFGNNEPGVWYDPSDLTTLFQDSAGTTPVTAVEQPVGLMLDKSQGLVLGPELVTNGDFSNGTTGWSFGGAVINTVSVIDGELEFTGAGDLGFWDGHWVSQVVFEAEDTKRYRVEFEATWVSGAGNLQAGAGFNLARTIAPNSGKTKYSFTTARGAAGGGDLRQRVTFGAGTGTVWRIDNVTVKQILGNHAFQTTSTKRPVLSRRVNLLTKTEDFSDAAWTKVRTTIVANAEVAPDGTTTMDKLVETTETGNHDLNSTVSTVSGTTYAASIYAKAAERSVFQIVGLGLISQGFSPTFDLSTGTVTNAPPGSSITPVGDGIYRCVVVATSSSTLGMSVRLFNSTVNGTSYTGDGTSGIYIWGASLVPADQASIPYQRVNTATDYDADPTKFPAYLKGDSVSGRAMVTNTITPGTDKVQVFAGVRKLADDTQRIVAETSVNRATNPGAFTLSAPFSTFPNIDWRARGTTDPTSLALTSYPAPITTVVTATSDIAGSSRVLRVNGASNSSGLSQGTGDFLAYRLYILARNQSLAYFTGHLYQMVVRFGPNLPTATIEAAEKFVANKTGISLT
jgi:hypothetical protein